MFKYNCLNPIASVGLDLFSNDYEKVEDLGQADAALVRSAAMHDLELPDCLLAVARAGAGVNNIPLDKCAEKGIVVFNTPGANANGVKELVFAGMLYASRDIVGGIDWCLANQNDDNIAKTAEKQKKNFAGTEISVFLFYAQELVQKLRKKDTHKKWYLCGVMAAVFGVAEMLHQSSHGEWFRDYLLYIGIPLFLFLPLFVLLWGKGKKRHEG